MRKRQGIIKNNLWRRPMKRCTKSNCNSCLVISIAVVFAVTIAMTFYTLQLNPEDFIETENFTLMQSLSLSEPLVDCEDMSKVNDKDSFQSNDKLFGHRRLCTSILPLINTENDFENVQAAFEKVEAFHHGGGNFQSVSNYLTSHIDVTLERHGLEYIPKGETSGAENAANRIRDDLRKEDIYKQGGYGQRKISGQFRNAKTHPFLIGNDRGVPRSMRFIDVVEPFTRERWDVGLGPIVPKVCSSVETIEVGNRRKAFLDKAMCSYSNFKNNTRDKNDECHLLSIGSNDEWIFEEKFLADTNCTIHTFDCTVKEARNKPDTPFIKFYQYCISNQNEVKDEYEYLTYFKMIEKAGLTKPPSLFKMDVEGFEYGVFTQMLDEAVASGSMDMLPSQISVELHYATRMYDLPWMVRTLTSAEIAMFVGMMYSRGGYVITNYKFDKGCAPCAEILFVKLLCE